MLIYPLFISNTQSITKVISRWNTVIKCSVQDKYVVHITHHFRIENDLEQSWMNREGRNQTCRYSWNYARHAKLLFWLSPGFKDRTFNSLGFSAEGAWIYVSMLPHNKAKMLRNTLEQTSCERPSIHHDHWLMQCEVTAWITVLDFVEQVIMSHHAPQTATHLNFPWQLEEGRDVIGLCKLKAADDAQNRWEVQLRCDPRQICTAVLPVFHFCQRASAVSISHFRCLDVEHLLDLPRPVDHTHWKRENKQDAEGIRGVLWCWAV